MISLFQKKSKRVGRKRNTKNSTPLLPAAVQKFLAHRVTDSAGVFFVTCGAILSFSLISYDVRDPSLNTTSQGDVIHNWLGGFGSYTADFLLQTLGFAAWFVACAFLVWGWRILTRRPLENLGNKISLLLFSVLFGAIFLARIPSFENWGIGTYLGGSAGSLIFTALGNTLQGWLGQMAFLFVTLSSFCLFVLCYTLALGISLKEWVTGALRTAGVTAAVFNTISAVLEKFHIWHRTYTKEGAEDNINRPRRRVQIKDSATPVANSGMSADQERKKPIVALRPEQPKKPAKKENRQTSLPLRNADENWEFPQLDFLQEAVNQNATRFDESALQKNAELLQSTLADFGVQGDITKVNPGPIVTLYELEPAPGTKTSRVIGLSDDIARSMSAVSVRVAVVPGKNAIGIELPNAKRETVYLRELLATKDYDRTSAKLPLVLGKNISGEPIVADLSRMPHLLVAGTTGSGKSVAVNTMILSLLYRLSPEQCRFIMIDPKMLELSVYDDIPHLLTPVVTEPHKAVTSLKWAVREMEDRYRAMSKLGVRNIEGFNQRLREARAKGEVLMHKVQTGFDVETGKPVFEEQPISQNELPYIVIIVDEFADLMLVAGKEVENAIQRLAQMARAAGIHLIMATQRPSVDVITGVIKANFPTRISFQVTSKIDSRTILGDGGAETLLGQGDMLYMASGGRITRVHGPFVSDGEVEQVVGHLREQGAPVYIDGVTDGDEEGGFGGMGGGDSGDELYDQAVALVIRERKASTSFVQRHLQIGYNRAARIVEQMEKQGIISAANHVGKREILIDDYGT